MYALKQVNDVRIRQQLLQATGDFPSTYYCYTFLQWRIIFGHQKSSRYGQWFYSGLPELHQDKIKATYALKIDEVSLKASQCSPRFHPEHDRKVQK